MFRFQRGFNAGSIRELEYRSHTHIFLGRPSFLLRRKEVFANRYPIRFTFRKPAPRNHEKPKVIAIMPFAIPMESTAGPNVNSTLGEVELEESESPMNGTAIENTAPSSQEPPRAVLAAFGLMFVCIGAASIIIGIALASANVIDAGIQRSYHKRRWHYADGDHTSD